ncbi:MAG: site-specific integrase [Verrucomicrobia bacterium]|nr:site-specific integrase [Verrucomicrobiota bacterium]
MECSPQYRRVPYLMSARTGIRHGELSQLLWGDIVLDEGNSHVRVRAGISKNKKEARIPLIRELEILLAEFRPVSAGDADKVFVKGVPRCRTLRKDLEAAGNTLLGRVGQVRGFSFPAIHVQYLDAEERFRSKGRPGTHASLRQEAD